MKLLNVELSDRQIEQFNRYFELIIEWNEKINLTAITDKDEVWKKHFEDSIGITEAIDLLSINSVIDIGTGAGFPGIPIKILFPHIKLTLLDSLNKRINFLNIVIEELGLENVETIHGRAEDFGKNPLYREKYDVCVSRAVANLATLSELCIPFVKVDGYFISYKAEKAEEELSTASKAIKILGGGQVNVVDVVLPDTDYVRKLITVKKFCSTAKKYPRKAGTPGKEPIL